MEFLPEFRKGEPKETRWILAPDIIEKFIEGLGFEETEVKYHFQKYRGRKHLLFTVVGHRTRDIHST